MYTIQQNKKYSMYNPISIMKGIPREYLEKLQHQGVKYTQQVLEQGHTPQQREKLAQKSGVPPQAIDELVGRADLMRLRGIGGDLSLLLCEAGVRSCRDLQEQHLEQLHRRLGELHIGQRIAYHAPSRAQLRSWINEAQELAHSSPEF